MNQKGSFKLAVLNYFLINDVKPWGESAGNGTPYCSC